VACECPAHIRVGFEIREALRDVARELRRNTIVMERATRRPPPVVRPVPAGPVPAGPVLRAAVEIVGSAFANPVVKQGLEDFLSACVQGPQRKGAPFRRR